jgi:predicted ester cyclase
MKKLCIGLSLALIFCFIVGCQDKAAMAELEEFKSQAAVEEQNKEIVRRYFEGIDKGDVESLYTLVEEIFDPEVIDSTKEHIKFAFATFGDMQHDIEGLVAEGDIVSMRGTFQATHKGNFFGVQPTGMRLSCPGLWMFRVKDGKIHESWIDNDSLLSLAMQIGLELKPKEGEK